MQCTIDEIRLGVLGDLQATYKLLLNIHELHCITVFGVTRHAWAGIKVAAQQLETEKKCNCVACANQE